MNDIDNLVVSLKTKLVYDGKRYDILSEDEYKSILMFVLCLFNSIPPFTFYTLKDENKYSFYYHLLKGAVIVAGGICELKDKKKIYTYQKEIFEFPTISQLMETEQHDAIFKFCEQVKEMKKSIL